MHGCCFFPRVVTWHGMKVWSVNRIYRYNNRIAILHSACPETVQREDNSIMATESAQPKEQIVDPWTAKAGEGEKKINYDKLIGRSMCQVVKLDLMYSF